MAVDGRLMAKRFKGCGKLVGEVEAVAARIGDEELEGIVLGTCGRVFCVSGRVHVSTPQLNYHS